VPGREATATALAAAVKYPYPGLRPFRENEEHLFFGRESQVDRMVDKLARTQFLAVVGSSGSGKSSLVNCGLKPALRRGLMARAGTSWRMAQFRPGSDPIRAMAGALSKDGVLFKNFAMEGLSLPEMVRATLEMSKLGLLDLYDQAQQGERANLLVVVDQFEELFRYRSAPSRGSEDQFGSDEKSVAFINLLLEAAEATDYPIYVVLTMRSDFLGDCAQFPGLPEAINEGQYLVPRMTREERRAAITGPAAVGGGQISPVLLTRLVNDVGDNPDQLSILQHALNRTWSYWRQNANSEGELSLEHYEAIGTMANALDQHAEEAYAELADDREKKICQKIFQALTDKGTDARGIRRPTTVEVLCALSEANPVEVKRVIEVFRKPSRSFLMPPRPEPLEPQTIIDISHESLMRVWRRLKCWVDEEAESAASYRRLAQNAALRDKGAAGLMTEPELSLTLDWRDKWRPNAAWAGRYYPGFDRAIAFLEESRTARDTAIQAENDRRRRELRRARIWAAILLVFFCVASGFAIFGFIERGKAKAAQETLQDTLRTVKQANLTAQTTEQTLLDAENEETAAEAALKSDTAARKSADVIAQDRSNLTAAQQNLRTARLEAAVLTAQAAAVNANGTLVDPSSLSTSDLFAISHGVQITSADNGVHNPTDMFGGTEVWSGSPEMATFFADGKSAGAGHWISWRTKQPVSVASVALFAAEDPGNKRAFKRFTLYAQNANGKWSRLVLYPPTRPYGGTLPSCGSGPCRWPQSDSAGTNSGTALSVCLEVSPIMAAREFKAEFVQAGNGLGPRIVQLDGHAGPNCTK
jgi:energy-coupling factor transporter ATP-binding protein EcfA2